MLGEFLEQTILDNVSLEPSFVNIVNTELETVEHYPRHEQSLKKRSIF